MRSNLIEAFGSETFFVCLTSIDNNNGGQMLCIHARPNRRKDQLPQGQGHFVTSHSGDNMASVTWATKVLTNWVDQIEQLTDIFEEVSMFVAPLPSPSSNLEAWPNGTSLRPGAR